MFSTRYFILFSTAFLYFLPTCARAARVLAPYLLVSSEKELAFDIASCIADTGLEAITLSHITADAGGNPAWLGVTPIDSEYAVNLVEQAHSSGMQVIVSFEGTSGGYDLASSASTADALATLYQTVINFYSLTWIDVDFYSVENMEKKCAALKLLQKRNPGLRIQVTLSTDANGLDSHSREILQFFQKEHFTPHIINLLTLDYKDVEHGSDALGTYVISAVEASHEYIQSLGFPELVEIGISPMIGKNDIINEVFHLEDAQQLVQWAKSNPFVTLLSFWSLNRDNDDEFGPLHLSTQIKQSSYQFTSIFSEWTREEIVKRGDVALPPPVVIPRNITEWPSIVFAPYTYISPWSGPLNKYDWKAAQKATGTKFWSLCFITSDDKGNPTWGGRDPIETLYYVNYINGIRKAGGDVVVSFGGAFATEIAQSNWNVNVLASHYQKVVDFYLLDHIDLDIEMETARDKASVDRRSAALAIVQANRPNLKISYTLAVTPWGLDHVGIDILKSALNAGVILNLVNLMTMDYGGSDAKNMGQVAITASKGAYAQLQELGMSSCKIGITSMIGVNDVLSEITYQSDARYIAAWAAVTPYIGLVSFWETGRDTSLYSSNLAVSSAIKQEMYEFHSLFLYAQKDNTTALNWENCNKIPCRESSYECCFGSVGDFTAGSKTCRPSSYCYVGKN